ncbi:hypothetical protein [Rhizobium tubonense]|uniref:SHOCT domain-containing protein n=1 Tax=Rhizobium tubonense TaxID=484088 RepID=A0A2W4CD45_9HYPH|nr:hypothetical protein CPY51_20710 [Rhizobium tubonense]
MDGGMVASFNRYSVICGILAIALAGCSTPAERAAWAAKRAAPTAVVMKSKDGTPVDGTGAAISKDGFPDFNTPLTAANVQINDTQATDIRSQLTALGAQRQTGAISQAEYDRKVIEMRKLAANHGQDTLSEIQK